MFSGKFKYRFWEERMSREFFREFKRGRGEGLFIWNIWGKEYGVRDKVVKVDGISFGGFFNLWKIFEDSNKKYS